MYKPFRKKYLKYLIKDPQKTTTNFLKGYNRLTELQNQNSDEQYWTVI